jgi:hypothetical protein
MVGVGSEVGGNVSEARALRVRRIIHVTAPAPRPRAIGHVFTIYVSQNRAQANEVAICVTIGVVEAVFGWATPRAAVLEIAPTAKPRTQPQQLAQ